MGGVSEVYEIAQAGGRTMMDNVDVDPRSRMTIYGCIIGGMFMWYKSSMYLFTSY